VLRPGGQLLLLEHGRSSWDFINALLDRDAPQHYQKWGCWWNRDISQLVKDVRSFFLPQTSHRAL
jgi:methyltransferase OMS1, mitochondrial